MWMYPHTIKPMETNTNTPEAKQPASAGCHHTPCSACGYDRLTLEAAAQSAVNTLVRENERLRERYAKAEASAHLAQLQLDLIGGCADLVRNSRVPFNKREHRVTLCDGTECNLKIWICDSKNTVQRLVTDYMGFLPSDLSDAASVDEDGIIYIWVRHDSTPARVAHEAYHATTMLIDKIGINPNDYSLHCPRADDADFGFIPAELPAVLIENIVSEVLLQQRKFYLPNA